MRIIFIGAVESSEVLLKTLIDMGENVVGVVTKAKSSFNTDFVDISYLLRGTEASIFYFTSENKGALFKWAQALKPDVIFCFGWSHLLEEDIIKLPSLGTFGFHPSPLPNNRGRHPIVWTLALGLDQTASSFFYITTGVDEGDIISQSMVEVTRDDDARSLYDRIMSVAEVQVREFVPLLKKGALRPITQDISRGNSWRKRSAKDSLIDFRMSSQGIYNLVRALTRPYLGADVSFHDQKYKVWRVQISERPFPKNYEPGKVLEVDGEKITIKCQDGAVTLLDHDLPPGILVGDYL